ncbi:diguanylate cyclase [Pseudoalteromonas sp. OOF1S-7]|uniref:diguanylate cyclase domain-containing protein n=1 Tax=Pseudoalteromonas sp. OOF1S-7 TaxID=2917757 RepID=UPI001EF5ACE3|nr:diguanylate cyclase [Pseudoalteromonas sp. OOF1S-7]MCG7535064.1 diguanylate cyclase [Pseudoalteromonas sp. OOF1S-7]
MQLSKKDALKLYKLSGADKKDVVTGFAIAADRPPTVQRAIERLQDKPTENAFYIEVDIQNLGGLNQVLGHSGADKVYRQMASLTKQQIALLAADSCDFRHGGDEFSFIVTGEGLTISHVEHALSTASKNIKLYAEEQSLSDIVHPKHKNDPSKSGTGIIYGVSQLHAKAEIDTVFSTADTIVEKKKLQ